MAKRRGTGQATVTGDMVPVVCSECYFEIMYSPGSEGIECPACGHACDTPDEAQIHRIRGHLSSAKTSAIVSIALLIVAIGASFFLFNAMLDPSVNADSEPAVVYGGMAGAILGGLGAIVMGWKHGNSYYDAYF